MDEVCIYTYVALRDSFGKIAASCYHALSRWRLQNITHKVERRASPWELQDITQAQHQNAALETAVDHKKVALLENHSSETAA